MSGIYEEAVQGYDVTGATASCIRGLIRDAWDLEIALAGPGVFVEALPQPPHGIRKILGRFSSILEAQNFTWAWLTSPYGVARDVRFIKVAPSVYGIDFDVLTRDIRSYLENLTTKYRKQATTRAFKGIDNKHREVYTSLYGLTSLASIISSNTDKYNRWNIYITIGCTGNYIFGPYKVEINTPNGMWRIQSAETVYDLHMGNGHTEEEGELLDCSMESVFYVLKKACYK